MMQRIFTVGRFRFPTLGLGACCLLVGGCAQEDLKSAALIPKTQPIEANAVVVTKDEKEDTPKAVKPDISASGPWPVAKVMVTTFNFGRMAVGDSIGEHSFVVRNTGEADLILKAGDATCQCTSFKPKDEIVRPGAETSIDIKWQTKHANPSFRHGGPVYTNDPKNPEIEFHVEGIIDEAIVALPSLIWDVGSIQKDTQASMTAVIASKVHEEFQIESLTAETSHVHLTPRPMSSDEKKNGEWLSGYVVDVKVDSDIPAGTFIDNIRMKVDVLKDSRTFQLRALRVGKVRFLPAPGSMFEPEGMLLKLGTFRSSVGGSGKMMLIVDHSASEEPLQVEIVEAKPPFLKAVLEQSGQRINGIQRYLLNVEIPPQRKHNALVAPAHIDLRTNHKEFPTFRVFVKFNSN
jgi:hypothetical protein